MIKFSRKECDRKYSLVLFFVLRNRFIHTHAPQTRIYVKLGHFTSN